MRGEPMVREDKRRRVRQAADELGYRMNLAARSLSNVRSKTIGVLVADLRNPLLVDVVERAGQVFEDEGLSTLLISAVMPARPSSGPRIDSRAIGALKDLRVEAMLVVGSVPDRQALAEVLGDMPVVVAAAGAEGLRADVVRNDDHLGMRLVVDYLVAARAHGRRPPGRAGWCRRRGACRRLLRGDDAPRARVGDHGRRVRLHRGRGLPRRRTAAPGWATGDRDRRGQRPGRGRGDVGGRRRRLRVPGDVAVTGYDDTFVVRDPPGVVDLGQPRQLWHRNSGGALRAPSDRGSRAARGGASAAAAAGDALQLGRAVRWFRAVAAPDSEVVDISTTDSRSVKSVF